MSDRLEQQAKKPSLYVVVCASGIAGDVGKLITATQEANWDVGVIATPQGLGFIDATAVEAQTGCTIRSAWRSPGEPRPLPPADAIVQVQGPSATDAPLAPGQLLTFAEKTVTSDHNRP